MSEWCQHQKPGFAYGPDCPYCTIERLREALWEIGDYCDLPEDLKDNYVQSVVAGVLGADWWERGRPGLTERQGNWLTDEDIDVYRKAIDGPVRKVVGRAHVRRRAVMETRRPERDDEIERLRAERDWYRNELRKYVEDVAGPNADAAMDALDTLMEQALRHE